MENESKCSICGNDLYENINWTLSLNYSTYGNSWINKICINCASKTMKIPIRDLMFLQELVNFKRENNLLTGRIWEGELVEKFIKKLKEKKIPLDVKIPLWKDYNNGKEFYILEKLNKTNKVKEIIEKLQRDLRDKEERKKREKEEKLKEDKIRVGGTFLSRKKFKKLIEKSNIYED